MYVYILYPRCKVAKLVILCMALSITTILVAGEWLNSLKGGGHGKIFSEFIV